MRMRGHASLLFERRVQNLGTDEIRTCLLVVRQMGGQRRRCDDPFGTLHPHSLSSFAYRPHCYPRAHSTFTFYTGSCDERELRREKNASECSIIERLCIFIGDVFFGDTILLSPSFFCFRFLFSCCEERGCLIRGG
jgi:hypothetical protein